MAVLEVVRSQSAAKYGGGGTGVAFLRPIPIVVGKAGGCAKCGGRKVPPHVAGMRLKREKVGEREGKRQSPSFHAGSALLLEGGSFVHN